MSDTPSLSKSVEATGRPDEKNPAWLESRGSSNEPVVGELLPGEAEAGGLGRHLGLTSTTFLM